MPVEQAGRNGDLRGRTVRLRALARRRSEPLVISPGDTVELRFGCTPDRFTVTAWKAECATLDHSRYDEKIDVTINDNGTFTLPSDGMYLYEIDAEWDKQGKVSGDATYAFAAGIAE